MHKSHSPALLNLLSILFCLGHIQEAAAIVKKKIKNINQRAPVLSWNESLKSASLCVQSTGEELVSFFFIIIFSEEQGFFCFWRLHTIYTENVTVNIQHTEGNRKRSHM